LVLGCSDKRGDRSFVVVELRRRFSTVMQRPRRYTRLSRRSWRSCLPAPLP
jgi:hypothetical protein